jgi:hypothetical protein
MTALFTPLAVLLAFVVSSPGLDGRVRHGARSETAAQQSEKKVDEHYTAIASNVSELAAAGIVQLDIWITRYTDDAEEEKLMAALDQKGQDGLVEEFRRTPPVGRMRAPGQLAVDFHYARQYMGKDGRRRIILATDRAIGFVEATNRGRSMEYPLTMLELRVDDSGHGDGQLFLASRFIRTGNLLVLENFGTQAVMISRVRQQKR